MAALLESQEELIGHYKQEARAMTALQQDREDERARPPMYRSSFSETSVSSRVGDSLAIGDLSLAQREPGSDLLQAGMPRGIDHVWPVSSPL